MKDLISQWKKEEQATFKGWDFSYLKGRYKRERPTWNYKEKAKKLIKEASALLDMGTGGGEILSSLGPFPKHVIAIEGWPLNVSIAEKKLKPLGVKVVAIDESKKLPFTDGEFDLVLNRQSAFNGREVFRVLQNKGNFLTQQVGGDNLKDLIQEFNTESKFKNWTLELAKEELEEVGFEIEQADEWLGKVEFKDVGALVYFLKAIPWIVKDFSVDGYLSVLQRLQNKINIKEKLIFTETRFLIQAKK